MEVLVMWKTCFEVYSSDDEGEDVPEMYAVPYWRSKDDITTDTSNSSFDMSFSIGEETSSVFSSSIRNESTHSNSIKSDSYSTTRVPRLHNGTQQSKYTNDRYVRQSSNNLESRWSSNRQRSTKSAVQEFSRDDWKRSPLTKRNKQKLSLQKIRETWYNFSDDSSDSSGDEGPYELSKSQLNCSKCSSMSSLRSNKSNSSGFSELSSGIYPQKEGQCYSQSDSGACDSSEGSSESEQSVDSTVETSTLKCRNISRGFGYNRWYKAKCDNPRKESTGIKKDNTIKYGIRHTSMGFGYNRWYKPVLKSNNNS